MKKSSLMLCCVQFMFLDSAYALAPNRIPQLAMLGRSSQNISTSKLTTDADENSRREWRRPHQKKSLYAIPHETTQI